MSSLPGSAPPSADGAVRMARVALGYARLQPSVDLNEGQLLQVGTDLALFGAIEEGVVAIDERSVIVFFNAAAERMFGYPAAEVLGRSIGLLLPEAARANHHRHVSGFRKSDAASRMKSERSDVRGRRSDGIIFDAEVSISKCTIGASLVLMAIIRDVTERKLAEARLLASEQKNRAVLDTCSDAILIADAETGLILEANGRAAELFDCRVADLVGLHQSELHPEADRERYRSAFREHLEYGRILVPDAAILRRDGTVVPVEITARPTMIGGVLLMVGFFRDITHHKEHERQLIEAREAAMAANRSKTTFLANVSHELRTPLTAVIAFAEMIGSGFFGPVGHPKYLEYANDIRDSGQHLLALINDILDLSQVEAGRLVLHEERLDLAELISECWRSLRPSIVDGDLRPDTNIMPDARYLRADRRAVRQMLLNLLSNAIRHTPPGGRICILVKRADDGGLVLRVLDTGVGIPLERLASVTTPFNARNARTPGARGGTGLGLAITKGLLERHGGTLEIHSWPEVGTTVDLVFSASRMGSADDVSCD